MTEISIADAFELYRIDFISFKGQSKKTEESYTVASRLLLRMYGNLNVSELTFAHVRDWKNWLGGWQKPDTTRNNIVCLRVVLKFLRARGFNALDPDLIPVPKREARQVTYLTEEEFEEFILEVGRPIRGYSIQNRLRNVAVVKLLYDTGLRNSELCSLNRNSIKNRTFSVIGKGGKVRIGFVSEDASRAIEEYLASRTDTDKALFVSEQTGKRMTPDTLRKIFKNVCARSGFEDIHPHTIRHSFATKLLRHRVDIRHIKDFMGHESLATTQIYTHVTDEDLKAIYDRVHKA